MDAPAFLYSGKERSNSPAFIAATRADILATIEFLYSRGMWSKYHYEQWKKEATEMKCEETLHLWWDSIVGGAMFEVEPNFEFKREAVEEVIEDKVEMKMNAKHKTPQKL